jgi:hypothetical protein
MCVPAWTVCIVFPSVQIEAAVDSKRLEGLLSGKVQLPLTDRVDLCTTPVRERRGGQVRAAANTCSRYQHTQPG